MLACAGRVYIVLIMSLSGESDLGSASDVESDEEGSEAEVDEEDGTDQEEPVGVRHFSGSGSRPAQNDSQRGEAVRRQLGMLKLFAKRHTEKSSDSGCHWFAGIWDGLLEARIKLQKPLSSSNCLPRGRIFEKFKSGTGNAGKRDVQNGKAEPGDMGSTSVAVVFSRSDYCLFLLLLGHWFF